MEQLTGLAHLWADLLVHEASEQLAATDRPPQDAAEAPTHPIMPSSDSACPAREGNPDVPASVSASHAPSHAAAALAALRRRAQEAGTRQPFLRVQRLLVDGEESEGAWGCGGGGATGGYPAWAAKAEAAALGMLCHPSSSVRTRALRLLAAIAACFVAQRSVAAAAASMHAGVAVGSPLHPTRCPLPAWGPCVDDVLRAHATSIAQRAAWVQLQWGGGGLSPPAGAAQPLPHLLATLQQGPAGPGSLLAASLVAAAGALVQHAHSFVTRSAADACRDMLQALQPRGAASPPSPPAPASTHWLQLHMLHAGLAGVCVATDRWAQGMRLPAAEDFAAAPKSEVEQLASTQGPRRSRDLATQHAAAVVAVFERQLWPLLALSASSNGQSGSDWHRAAVVHAAASVHPCALAHVLCSLRTWAKRHEATANGHQRSALLNWLRVLMRALCCQPWLAEVRSLRFGTAGLGSPSSCRCWMLTRRRSKKSSRRPATQSCYRP